MLRYVFCAILLIALIFPIFSDLFVFWNKDHKKLYFFLRIFGFIKIYGGYLQAKSDCIAIHVSKYKAYLLPYKEVLPTTGKKLQITRGFHVTKVNIYSEIGYLDHEATFLIGGLLQILFSYAFLFGKQNGFTFHGNTTLFTGDRIDVFIKMQFVFNLLILILAGIKIIINKGIEYAKRKQT